MNRPGAAPTWEQNVKAGSQVIFYVLIFALLSQLSSAAAGGQGEAASRLSGLRIPYKASSLPWITYHLKGQANLEPILVGVINGQVGYEYVLTVNRGNGITQLPSCGENP